MDSNMPVIFNTDLLSGNLAVTTTNDLSFEFITSITTDNENLIMVFNDVYTTGQPFTLQNPLSTYNSTGVINMEIDTFSDFSSEWGFWGTFNGNVGTIDSRDFIGVYSIDVLDIFNPSAPAVPVGSVGDTVTFTSGTVILNSPVNTPPPAQGVSLWLADANGTRVSDILTVDITNVVPEPATTLLLFGATAMALFQRQRS